jgi:AcrR family transcriptional regulator
MGRRQTIDREKVLAVAEDIVGQRGAAALTIDAVAKAAGITKGGVQSAFGTKEALIAAMLRLA